MNVRKIILNLSLLFIVCVSCTTDDPQVSSGGRGALVASTDVATLTKDQVVEAVSEFSVRDIAVNDVTLHTIRYQTDYEGQIINASGLVMLPKGISAPRLLAYFHGTLLPLKILTDKATPSLYKGEKTDFSEVRQIGLSFASAGYAVFLPDYIGYGITDGREHPYIYYPEMFKSNIDGLLAAREFMTKQGLSPNKQLLLTGWSQGGGASLSAHKYIQEQYADQFTVVASSSLAGPFNVTRFVNSILEKPDQENGVTFVASWALYSINKFSAVKRPTDQIWTYPVPNQSAALLPQSKKPSEVFKGAFIAGIVQGTDKPMVDVLKSTSVYEGWKPVGKVFLHHADTDRVVPYFNSVDAEAGLKAQGGDVKLYTYPGGDHDTELDNFVLNTVRDFNAIK